MNESEDFLHFSCGRDEVMLSGLDYFTLVFESLVLSYGYWRGREVILASLPLFFSFFSLFSPFFITRWIRYRSSYFNARCSLQQKKVMPSSPVVHISSTQSRERNFFFALLEA